jgi:sulfofructose kinase
MSARVLCLGVAVQDYVFALPQMPTLPQKYRASDFALVGGGCAGNAAVTIARLGGEAYLATRLGADRLAESIIAELESEGVDCTYVARFENCRSSISAVLVDAAGERTIVNYRDPMLPEDVDWLRDMPALKPNAVLVDTRWPVGAEAALSHARTLGVPAIVDAEPPVRPSENALLMATHIAFSRDGLEDWAGTDDIARGLAKAAAETKSFVCVTDGARGVYYRNGDDAGWLASFPVDAVDTLAAGDIWHGAFALPLAEGRNEVEAIRFASATAALKCTRFGGRAAIPDRGQVESFLLEQAI